MLPGTWRCRSQVCAMLWLPLKKGGFLLMDGAHFLHLTDLGREVAEDTYEKHRFLQRCL